MTICIGAKIKELRKRDNMTQEQLAEKLNVSRQAVSKWESNTAYPDISNLILLRDIFDVTLDYLVIDNNKIESDLFYHIFMNMSRLKIKNIFWNNFN